MLLVTRDARVTVQQIFSNLKVQVNREPCREPWTGGTVRSKTVKLGLPQWRTGRILEKMSKPYNALLARRAGVISSGGGIESAGVT
jgi:hypothetical protein